MEKLVLEQELEELINTKEGDVKQRVGKGIGILESISSLTQSQETLESYINNNK